MSARKLAFISFLASLSVVGRIGFSFIPNVQPVSAIIIITAFTLGPINGLIMAALSAILSNFVLGMGLWTAGQIVAWGFIGLLSGFIGKRIENIPYPFLVLYSGFCGLLYGFVISFFLYYWAGHFWAYYITGLPFDIAHSIGNMAFFIILYPILTNLLKRYKVDKL